MKKILLVVLFLFMIVPTEINALDNEPVSIDEPVLVENLLKDIESNIVDIKLVNGTYNYTIEVNDDIKELDLKPIPNDDKYEVSISTQKLVELTNNMIIVKVSDGTNIEEYKIKVDVLKKTEEVFNETNVEEFKYKDKWAIMIVALSGLLSLGVFLSINNK